MKKKMKKVILNIFIPILGLQGQNPHQSMKC